MLRYYFKQPNWSPSSVSNGASRSSKSSATDSACSTASLAKTRCWANGSATAAAKFRIHIRQLDWQRFHEFLPIGPGYQPLCALVRFTLRDPLDYDIRLVLRHEEIREFRIGAQNACRLG